MLCIPAPDDNDNTVTRGVGQKHSGETGRWMDEEGGVGGEGVKV